LETKNTQGGFEGVGEIGLKWLKKQKKRQVVNGTEVANATHEISFRI
jgi:chorismate mutase